jgi:hypothetical protein
VKDPCEVIGTVAIENGLDSTEGMCFALRAALLDGHAPQVKGGHEGRSLIVQHRKSLAA